MAIKKISYEQGREQWLELRKQYLGGSDAAAVLGLSKWSSPLSVYADKLALVPGARGQRGDASGAEILKAYVAERFCEATGLKVRRENHILVNDAYPFMCEHRPKNHQRQRRVLSGPPSVYNKTDFSRAATYHLSITPSAVTILL